MNMFPLKLKFCQLESGAVDKRPYHSLQQSSSFRRQRFCLKTFVNMSLLKALRFIGLLQIFGEGFMVSCSIQLSTDTLTWNNLSFNNLRNITEDYSMGA